MPLRRPIAGATPCCLQWSLATFTVWVLPQAWCSRYIWHCFTAACRSSARTSRDEEAAFAAAAHASPSNPSRISPSCAHICRDEEHAVVAAAVRGFRPYPEPYPHTPAPAAARRTRRWRPPYAPLHPTRTLPSHARTCRDEKNAAVAAAARALSGPLVLMPQSPGWRLPSVCVRLPGTCRENPSHTCIGMLLLRHSSTSGCVMPSVCSKHLDQTNHR